LDREYAQRYRELFEKHWWWRARTKYVLETLRRHRPASGWKAILDVGCGDGLFFDYLKEFGQVEGVEPDAELVRADNPDRKRIYICPFDENFAPGKTYSLVLMLDVLEHLPDPISALKHALDLLEPQGTFIATVPAFMALWTNHDVINHHRTRYTKQSFRDLSKNAGLQIVEERYLYHWTFPVKLSVRLAERALQFKPKPAAVPNVLVNEILYRLSRLEQLSLSRLPIPFGSSLMVVGKRAK
jgi:SAM-dependent methyltransferase